MLNERKKDTKRNTNTRDQKKTKTRTAINQYQYRMEEKTEMSEKRVATPAKRTRSYTARIGSGNGKKKETKGKQNRSPLESKYGTVKKESGRLGDDNRYSKPTKSYEGEKKRNDGEP